IDEQINIKEARAQDRDPNRERDKEHKSIHHRSKDQIERTRRNEREKERRNDAYDEVPAKPDGDAKDDPLCLLPLPHAGDTSIAIHLRDYDTAEKAWQRE